MSCVACEQVRAGRGYVPDVRATDLCNGHEWGEQVAVAQANGSLPTTRADCLYGLAKVTPSAWRPYYRLQYLYVVCGPHTRPLDSANVVISANVVQPFFYAYPRKCGCDSPWRRSEIIPFCG